MSDEQTGDALDDVLAEGREANARFREAFDLLPADTPPAYARLANELAERGREADDRLATMQVAAESALQSAQRELNEIALVEGPTASAPESRTAARAEAEAERAQREITALELSRAQLAAVEGMRDAVLLGAASAEVREERLNKLTENLLKATYGLAVIALVALVVAVVGVIIAA